MLDPTPLFFGTSPIIPRIFLHSLFHALLSPVHSAPITTPPLFSAENNSILGKHRHRRLSPCLQSPPSQFVRRSLSTSLEPTRIMQSIKAHSTLRRPQRGLNNRDTMYAGGNELDDDINVAADYKAVDDVTPTRSLLSTHRFGSRFRIYTTFHNGGNILYRWNRQRDDYIPISIPYPSCMASGR